MANGIAADSRGIVVGKRCVELKAAYGLRHKCHHVLILRPKAETAPVVGVEGMEVAQAFRRNLC